MQSILMFYLRTQFNHDGENFKQTDETQRERNFNSHVLFRPTEYFSMLPACHTINSAELQDGKRKRSCKGLNGSDRGLICGTIAAIYLSI